MSYCGLCMDGLMGGWVGGTYLAAVALPAQHRSSPRTVISRSEPLPRSFFRLVHLKAAFENLLVGQVLELLHEVTNHLLVVGVVGWVGGWVEEWKEIRFCLSGGGWVGGCVKPLPCRGCRACSSCSPSAAGSRLRIWRGRRSRPGGRGERT